MGNRFQPTGISWDGKTSVFSMVHLAYEYGNPQKKSEKLEKWKDIIELPSLKSFSICFCVWLSYVWLLYMVFTYEHRILCIYIYLWFGWPYSQTCANQEVHHLKRRSEQIGGALRRRLRWPGLQRDPLMYPASVGQILAASALWSAAPRQFWWLESLGYLFTPPGMKGNLLPRCLWMFMDVYGIYQLKTPASREDLAASKAEGCWLVSITRGWNSQMGPSFFCCGLKGENFKSTWPIWNFQTIGQRNYCNIL